MRMGLLLAMSMVIGFAAFARAEEPTGVPGTVGRGIVTGRDTEPESHPDLSGSDAWVRKTVEGILVLFGAALLIGPWVRRNVPEDVPPAHSHDEPPGASHHHGPGGTISPEPHD